MAAPSKKGASVRLVDAPENPENLEGGYKRVVTENKVNQEVLRHINWHFRRMYENPISVGAVQR